VNVPAYVTAIQGATTVAFVLAVIVVLRRARERATVRSGVPEAVGVTLLAWLGTTTALALAGVYRATPDAAASLPFAVLLALGGTWIGATTIPSLVRRSERAVVSVRP
jgi:hypothetical protein